MYFYVPKGTKHFVIGFSGCKTNTKVEIKNESGKTIFYSDKIMAGDQISIIVPADSDDQIWNIAITSLRNTVELYDIPAFLARNPVELLVPVDAIK